MSNNSSAGKGDSPRNCFSKQFRDNYEQIAWPSKTKNTSSTNQKTREKTNRKK
jgi:hypothetical protein